MTNLYPDICLYDVVLKKKVGIVVTKKEGPGIGFVKL